jgi:purine-binding chemotaxis protein CheW
MTESSVTRAHSPGLVLAVRIGDKLHAIPITAVEEVLPALPIEQVPQCPAFVLGVVFVRGHVIPVLSAAQRLGVENYERPDEPNIVCLRIGERIIGVEFDEAIDLIDIGEDESLAANKLGVGSNFFTGVIDHNGQIIRLLDPEKLISETEAAQLQQVQGSS